MSLLSNIKALFNGIASHERAVVKLTDKAFEEARQAHGFVEENGEKKVCSDYFDEVNKPIPPESEIRVDHSLEEKRTGEFYFGVVEPEKPELTEPVELLLKAMRERTETFCITLGHNPYNDLYSHSWDVLDTKTNFKFTLKIRNISRDLFLLYRTLDDRGRLFCYCRFD